MSEKQVTGGEVSGSPEDIINAHYIVEEELGQGVDVNYMGLPKSVGVMGDSRIYGHTAVISARDNTVQRRLLEDYEAVDRAAQRICNETKAASRVVLDITPEGGYFKK